MLILSYPHLNPILILICTSSHPQHPRLASWVQLWSQGQAQEGAPGWPAGGHGRWPSPENSQGTHTNIVIISIISSIIIVKLLLTIL